MLSLPAPLEPRGNNVVRPERDAGRSEGIPGARVHLVDLRGHRFCHSLVRKVRKLAPRDVQLPFDRRVLPDDAVRLPGVQHLEAVVPQRPDDPGRRVLAVRPVRREQDARVAEPRGVDHELLALGELRVRVAAHERIDRRQAHDVHQRAGRAVALELAEDAVLLERRKSVHRAHEVVAEHGVERVAGYFRIAARDAPPALDEAVAARRVEDGHQVRRALALARRRVGRHGRHGRDGALGQRREPLEAVAARPAVKDTAVGFVLLLVDLLDAAEQRVGRRRRREHRPARRVAQRRHRRGGREACEAHIRALH
mmetsp:Transcript_9500/g.29583  ORF Transcript_9500/g.29583 Transcript_9500/m.29583 type:complete len:311 (-) Transcript_9500:174-1106(-)